MSTNIFRCFEEPEETREPPIIMQSAPAISTIVARSNCIICHAESRSSVATLVLAQNQFDVMLLEGGMRDWEYETESI